MWDHPLFLNSIKVWFSFKIFIRIWNEIREEIIKYEPWKFYEKRIKLAKKFFHEIFPWEKEKSWKFQNIINDGEKKNRDRRFFLLDQWVNNKFGGTFLAD